MEEAGILEKISCSGFCYPALNQVAICHVYGISHLLTFNVSHFTRLARIGPGIVVVEPANV